MIKKGDRPRFICTRCGKKERRDEVDTTPCLDDLGHFWRIQPTEYKPRVIHFEITPKKKPEDPVWRDPNPMKIARWDKTHGLLVRLPNQKPYGVPRLDQYWKATEASPEAIVKTIRQVGGYLESGVMDFDSATELLDLLNQALARKISS